MHSLDITKMNADKFTIDKQLFDPQPAEKIYLNTFNKYFLRTSGIKCTKGVVKYKVHGDSTANGPGNFRIAKSN